MTIRVARHDCKQSVIPGDFMRVRAPASAGVLPWWLAGGANGNGQEGVLRG